MKNKLILTLVLIISLLLSACGGLDSMRADAIKEDTALLSEELQQSFEAAPDVPAMLDALIAFADENQLYYYQVDESALILVKQAADPATDNQDLTLQVSIDPADKEKSAKLTAILLSTLRNAGNDRKVTVMITAKDGRDYYGARAVPKSYLKTDNLISYNGEKTAAMYTNSSQVTTYTFTKAAKAEATEDRKAVDIRIGPMPGQVGENKNTISPNPTTEIYNILSYCEDNLLNYRIHSIETTGSAYGQPTGVHLVLSLAASDLPKFETRILKQQEKFLDKFGDDEGIIQYTYAMAALPTTALPAANAKELVGLIHTIRDHYDYMNSNENDDITAQNYITNITVNSTVTQVTATSRANDPETLAKIEETYQGLATLSNYTLEDTVLSPAWTMNEESLLRTTFLPSADNAGLSFQPTATQLNNEAGIFAAKNDDVDLLCLGIDPENQYPNVEALILFIESTSPF